MAGLDGAKKRGDSNASRVSRFSEVLGAAQESTQKPGYPEIHPSEQQPTQQPEKIAKRENPDYTQTTFRIPKKLSRQINRVLMDLADEGIEMDRSDLLELLAGVFLQLADEKGVVEALEQFKNLGIQIDE
jgi:hypothetical protein